MKKTIVFIGLLVFTVTVFGQVSKYQPKVIAMFLGEKSPHFDENRFPDIDFYYIVKEKYKNPKGMLEGMDANKALVFDKNGTLVTLTNNVNSTLGIDMGYYLSTKKGEFLTLHNLSKDYIKKGDEMKLGKKFKGKHPEKLSASYISFPLPDFNVAKADGEKVLFNSLVKDNPLTLVVLLHLDSDDDGAKGLESGADKTGKQFMNDVDQTYRFEKQIKALNSIENEIFGKKTNL